MFDWTSYWLALGAILAIGFAAWLVSIPKRDVSFIDSLWSLLFLAAAGIYFFAADATGPRAALVLLLTAIWALRLSAHITLRNFGKPEDPRYRAMREKRGSAFLWQSLYIVFGLQGLLAWIISVPLLVAIQGQASPGILDIVAVALWITGFVFEAVGDYQLRRFKADPKNEGKVLQSGLWRYTRHPNYFGDACVWWSFFLFAAATGGWWTVYSPLLMTFLLLKVSGVALLEKDIDDRRPRYAEYKRRTNAFFPGRPKSNGASA